MPTLLDVGLELHPGYALSSICLRQNGERLVSCGMGTVCPEGLGTLHHAKITEQQCYIEYDDRPIRYLRCYHIPCAIRQGLVRPVDRDRLNDRRGAIMAQRAGRSE